MHNKKRIYITRNIPQNGIEMLKAKGYEVIVGKDTKPVSPKKLNAILKNEEKKGKGYNGIITLLTDKINAATLTAGKSLEIVSNYAIGYDNFDLKAFTEKGIVATNAPGNYTDTIAEHTVALILSLSTRTVEADRYVRKGKYKGWDPMIFIGTDLSQKTVGLIGAGRIGEKVAEHLIKGFGLRVVYFDTFQNDRIEKEFGAVRLDSVDALLSESDIVSLHVPLLPSTHHMVNASFLSKMKKTAFLINTSRGAVVDEKALVSALQKNIIQGAALDVFEFEPKLARGLSKLENVVLTPHIASASEHARNEMSRVAAQNIIDVFEKRKPVGKITL